MKMRKVLKGFFILILLLLLLGAYLFFYIFPAFGQINRTRREATDIERQIKNYAFIKKSYVPFSEKEEVALVRIQGMTRDSLAQASTDNDWKALSADLTVFIQQNAQKYRIGSLNISTLMDQQVEEMAVKTESIDGKSLVSNPLQVTFDASSDNAFRFIFSILDFKFRLRVDAMSLDGENGNLSWKLFIHTYQRKGVLEWISRGSFPLDSESPILLQALPELLYSPGGTEPEKIDACRLDVFRSAAGLKK